ncbi:MAG: 16S rRNA processing protein RimM [Bacteroidaceae bacterium]|nr:16S rRNA processing protein RimM [Bacteroidaceae bacterium]
MQTLTFDDLTHVGTIGRKHGTRGELCLQLMRDIVNADGDVPDCLFIEIDSLPVPFFIDEWRERGTDVMLVKFDGVDSDAQAANLTGCSVYALSKDLPREAQFRSWQAFKGYTIKDEAGNVIGEITAVDDRNENILLYVSSPMRQEEIILPFHEDFVRNIDEKARTLQLSIPEGLLNIND